MSAPVLALLERSVRLETQRPGTYLARLGLVLIILGGMSFGVFFAMGRDAPGLAIFSQVVYLDLLFLTFMAMGHFASAITEEKEEMTLGLLRMTALSPVAILLGKSTSRLWSATMLLLAQLPFTLLAVMLGGLSAGQVFACYAVMAGYMVFLANLALLASVVAPRTSGAGGLVLLALFLLLLVPSLGTGLLALSTEEGWLAAESILAVGSKSAMNWLISSNPFVLVSRILGVGTGTNAGSTILAYLAGGGLFFLASWRAFDWATRDQRDAAAPRRRFLGRGGGRLQRLSVGRAWDRAIAWKDFHFMAGGRVGTIARLVGLGAVAAVIGVESAWSLGSFDDMRRTWSAATMITMIAMLCIEWLFQAGRIFNQEAWAVGERTQTLSALMILPVTPGRLAWEKVRGCLLGSRPYLFYFLLAAVASPGTFADFLWSAVSEPRAWLGICLVLTFLHLVAFLSLVLKKDGALLGAVGAMFAMWFVVPLWILPGLFFNFLADGMGIKSPFLREVVVLTPYTLLGAVAIWALEKGILRRLRTLAGQ